LGCKLKSCGYSWISYQIWPEFSNCYRQCFHWHTHHWKIQLIPSYKRTLRSWCAVVNIKQGTKKGKGMLYLHQKKNQ